MKKLLMTGVTLLALSAPAHAFEVVYDPVQDVQGLQELAQWVEQLAAMQRQYEQLVATYNALAHITDLSSAAYALGGVTRNYLPEANAIPDLMSDVANLWGRAGYFNSYDTYYASTVLDRWGKEMERRKGVTSNAKAMAAAGALEAQDHLANLAILQARLESARDVTEVAAVNGLIAIEQQNLDSHRAQIENVRLLLASDDRVAQQRAEQMQRESADMLLARTAPITDDLR
ncbi:type IV secretion system protein (plasmid) [Skermanella rosea]|uniref:type IV secretion system protein n=1 Tax=Skermanella rosea TaxID=1817965 RepID=UPI0019349858|nr:type IV secretion system protein [Skermanella rosea]UEM08125.1 type IV secretion system protein [Skermanella rosea]